MTECEIARLTIDESFAGTITVKLIKIETDNNNQSYVIDCNTSRYCSKDQHQRLEANRNYIEHLLRELESARVSVFSSKVMGCDGTDYELKLNLGLGDVTYRWWCDAPKGYEPVVKFANELLKLARSKERASIGDL